MSGGKNTIERFARHFRGTNIEIVRRVDFTKLLGDFFDLLLLRKPFPRLIDATANHTYTNNQAFWEDALHGVHFEEMEIQLENFHLTEWMPSAPGRYFTQEAIESRELAEHFFDSDMQEYRPFGKARLVLGGIGSLRIGEKLIGTAPTYFLGASSSGISHQGIPVAMNKEQYRNVIEPIKKHGGCIANLTGSLRLLPTSLSILQYTREVPKFCFFAKDLELLESSSENDLLTSIAIMFPSGYHFDYNRKNTRFTKDGYTTNMIKMWSFCSFNPSKKGNLESAVNWLKDYVARHSRLVNPPILSNFDEQYEHFENPIEFSLSKLFQEEIDFVRLNAYKDYYGLTINIGQLNMGDVFHNISNSTIVNRSMVEKSFNKVQRKYDKEVAMALLRVAEEISKSGNKEAGELFETFNEELQKPKPRQSVLKNIWTGIEKALPTIVQFVDIVASISKLFVS